MIRKKIILIGDATVGKRSLLLAYKEKKFISVYHPYVREEFVKQVDIKGEQVGFVFEAWDGVECFDRYRPLVCQNVDLVILCMSLDQPLSYDGIFEKYWPDIQKDCPSAPCMLVSNKQDLRNETDIASITNKSGKNQYSYLQGEMLAQEISALHYVECSAKNMTAVNEVFQLAMDSTTKRHKQYTMPQKLKTCCLS